MGGGGEPEVMWRRYDRASGKCCDSDERLLVEEVLGEWWGGGGAREELIWREGVG